MYACISIHRLIHINRYRLSPFASFILPDSVPIGYGRKLTPKEALEESFFKGDLKICFILPSFFPSLLYRVDCFLRANYANNMPLLFSHFLDGIKRALPLFASISSTISFFIPLLGKVFLTKFPAVCCFFFVSRILRH